MGAMESDARGSISTFTPDGIHGCIYVEGRDSQEVDRFLKGLADVYLQGEQAMKQLVPPNEEAATRAWITGKPTTVHRGSFVRVTCRGRYRGALGLVKRLDAETSRVHVVVEARGRAWKKVRRDDSGTAQDSEFCALELAAKAVSDSGVDATPQELEVFLHCRKEWVRQAAKLERTVLYVDDRVEVVVGSLKGLVGYITGIDTNGSVTLRVEGLAEDPIVHHSDVVRKFELGEFVRIVAGRYNGVEGCITHLADGEVSLFSPKVFREVGEVRSQINGK